MVAQFIIRLAVKFFDLNFIIHHFNAKLFITVFAVNEHCKSSVAKLCVPCLCTEISSDNLFKIIYKNHLTAFNIKAVRILGKEFELIRFKRSNNKADLKGLCLFHNRSNKIRIILWVHCTNSLTLFFV